MKPYYEDDFVKLYHGDCLEHPEWWTNADVLVTDPPYGIGWSVPEGAFNKHLGKRKHEVGHSGIRNDSDATARNAVLEQWGAARPGIVFGQLNEAPPERSKQTLIWQKPGNAGIFGVIGGWRRDTEAIYLLGKWPVIPATYSSVLKSGANAVSVYVTDTHPHAKPLDVMEQLIGSAPPGVIADPFAGSGSTLVAAKRLGRKAVGVELEEKYCEIAARRLSQGVLELWEVGA